MKNINQLIKNGFKTEQTEHNQATEQDKFFIGLLFERLREIFPAWKVAFPTEKEEAGARKQWLQGLVENGVTDVDSIKRGLTKCRQHDKPFLPSIGMFIKWCKPNEKELGLPSFDESYNQSVGNQKSCMAVIFTLRNMADSHGYRLMNATDSRKLWQIEWQKTIEYIANGGVLPEPEFQIEKQQKSIDIELSKKELEKLKGIF